MIPVPGFRRRTAPPPEPLPDLLAESGERATLAARTASEALGSTTAVAGIWFELPATRGLPDPYGPDPVVFGAVPRVRGEL